MGDFLLAVTPQTKCGCLVLINPIQRNLKIKYGLMVEILFRFKLVLGPGITLKG